MGLLLDKRGRRGVMLVGSAMLVAWPLFGFLSSPDSLSWATQVAMLPLFLCMVRISMKSFS